MHYVPKKPARVHQRLPDAGLCSVLTYFNPLAVLDLDLFLSLSVETFVPPWTLL